uniref:Putative ovule protein n=1 Tax=Solanum chacoense TaxID=4108 RepID=A0A0V0HM22_SOLCH
MFTSNIQLKQIMSNGSMNNFHLCPLFLSSPQEKEKSFSLSRCLSGFSFSSFLDQSSSVVLVLFIFFFFLLDQLNNL